MRELLTKYVLAMITASIAFIEPTFNFLLKCSMGIAKYIQV